MKILELTNYSSGICGVGMRVKQESEELVKLGYEVRIFSSNLIKGSNKIAPETEKLGKIIIQRFAAKKIGGESFLKWNFKNEAIKFHPDVIIAHSYRHKHTTQALKIAKKINAKVFLVTHAPFVEYNSTRSSFSKIAVSFYDNFIGPKTINQFDKVISINKWEFPYLKKLGVREDKLVYIPNGIPDEFFKQKIKKFNGGNILFLGRISPVKDLETLVKAFKIVQDKDKKIKLYIVGPEEVEYSSKIKDLVKSLSLNVSFLPPVYNLKDKIKIINGLDIFVLSSKREAMPQSLIEAMALGKLVISSKTQGGLEIVSDNKTGLLYDIGDEKELADKILWALSKENKKKVSLIMKNARKKAEEFKWSLLIKKLNELIK